MCRQTDRTSVPLAGITRRSCICTNPKKVRSCWLLAREALREVHFCLQVHVCLASRYLCRGAVLSSVGEASSVPMALEGPLRP